MFASYTARAAFRTVPRVLTPQQQQRALYRLAGIRPTAAGTSGGLRGAAALINTSTKLQSASAATKYETARLAVEDLNNMPSLGRGRSDGVHGVDASTETTVEESPADATTTKNSAMGLLCAQMPTVTFTRNTTLGEIYDSLWTNYKNRGLFVFGGVVLVLYSLMWNPYTSQSEREAAVHEAEALI